MKNPWIERPAILFLTPDAPWFSNAPWRVVKLLKNIFRFLKGRGPLNIFFKSAEIFSN